MMSVAAHTTSQLFFASATAIYQINMIAISKQVSQLLRLVRVEAALNLLKATTLSKSVVQRERVLAQFSQDAGVTLFVNLMFKEAAPHLCASYMDLRELLQLFGSLILFVSRAACDALHQRRDITLRRESLVLGILCLLLKHSR